MLALLKQPLNKGLHVTVIKSAADLPVELHPEARMIRVTEGEQARVDFTDHESVLRLAKAREGLLVRGFFLVG